MEREEEEKKEKMEEEEEEEAEEEKMNERKGMNTGRKGGEGKQVKESQLHCNEVSLLKETRIQIC